MHFLYRKITEAGLFVTFVFILNQEKLLLFHITCSVDCSYLQTFTICLSGSESSESVGDMPKSPSSQYGLKAQEDIDPRGIRVTNGPMR
jgi:hypothetical protein